MRRLGESLWRKDAEYASYAGCALVALLLGFACRGAGDGDPQTAASGRPEPRPSSRPLEAEAHLPDRAAALLTDPVFTPPSFCRDARRIDPFPWLPDDLPLPSDTVAVREIPPAATGPLVQAGLFVTPASIDDFIDFVDASWSVRGWKSGWGEREADEAEGTYFAGGRFAAFRLGACTGPGTALLIVTGESR